MAPFEFDLNELPSPEEDGANDAGAMDPVREPSPQDPLSPPPEREPLPQDPRPPPTEREPSPQELPPPPTEREPSLKDPPSPDLDLDAPLSPLDEDEDEDDAADPQLPGPPSQLPHEPEPRGSASPVTPSRSSGEIASDDDDDTLGATRLPDPPSRHGEIRRSPRAPLPDSETTDRPFSSQDTSAPRATSRGPSETTASSSHQSRHAPPHDVPRDDAISKRRRYDEDAASYSQEGSGRAAGGATSPRHYGQQTGRRRLVPPALEDGELGGPRPRNNRRRRQRPYGGSQHYGGQDQRMKGYRGRDQPHGNPNNRQDQMMQGYHGRDQPQGQERPPPSGQHHQAYHGPPPHGNARPIFSTQQQGPQGSSDYRPSYSGPHCREDSYRRRQNHVQEHPKTGGGGGYQHGREAVPFAGAHVREGAYGRRQSPVQEPPKNGGYYQHSREEPAFRTPPSRAHAKEDSYGVRQNPVAQEHDTNANGGYQQREAPRHGRVRPYHPYARDAGAFDDRANVGNQTRHMSRSNNYQHRRDDTRNKNGGGVRSRRPYEEVEK